MGTHGQAGGGVNGRLEAPYDDVKRVSDGGNSATEIAPMDAVRSPRSLLGFVATVAIAGVALSAVAARDAGSESWDSWEWLVVLTVAAAIAQIRPVFVAHGVEGEDVQLDELVWPSVFLLLPPNGVLYVIGLSAIAAQVILRRSAMKAVFNVGAGLAGGAVGLILIDVLAGPAGSPASPRQIAAVAVAVLACSFTLTGLVWVALSLATQERLRDIATAGARFSFIVLSLTMCWGLITAVAVDRSTWLIVAAAAPVVLLWDLQRASTDREVLRRLLEAAGLIGAANTEKHVVTTIESVAAELLSATSAMIVTAEPDADSIQSPVPTTSHRRQWVVIRRHEQALPWRKADQEVLDAVASMAATALDNVHLLNEIRDQAERDPLTQIPNRVVLERALIDAADAATAGLLVIDVDRFKRINDNLGHHVGDAVVVAVASRITEIVGHRGIVCRMGGDEFAVVTRELSPPEIIGLGETLLESMRDPIGAGDHELHLTVSVGITYQTESHTSAADLLRRAGAAANRSKRAGRDAIDIATTLAAEDDEFLLEQALRDAIVGGCLSVVYQPVLDVSGFVESAEALVRWRDPTHGPIAPDRFLPLAEQLGLMATIDLWVLEQAVSQVNAWASEGVAVRVAVNMSVSTLAQKGIVDRVLQVLAKYDVEPSSLEIEITEQISTLEPEVMVERLRQLRSRGVTIAIDDFGTGFSSLSRLQAFPVDRIKIDRSFLTATRDDDYTPIVSATIAIAHGLDLKVTAEGVEREDQLAYLCEQGCDSLQGFLFSPGVPPTAFADFYRHCAASAATPLHVG